MTAECRKPQRFLGENLANSGIYTSRGIREYEDVCARWYNYHSNNVIVYLGESATAVITASSTMKPMLHTRLYKARYTSCICQLGDSLVFVFPLAPMLTFTSAVGKLNVRVLWHHHMLLQVISQRYCQVFVKSYNFVFEKIDKEGSPVKSDKNKAISVPRAMGILPPPKYPRVVKQPPKN